MLSFSAEGRYFCIRDYKLIASFEATPEVAYNLIHGGCKDAVDVAEHTLSLFHTELLPQKIDYRLEALRAADFENSLPECRRGPDSLKSNRD